MPKVAKSKSKDRLKRKSRPPTGYNLFMAKQFRDMPPEGTTPQERQEHARWLLRFNARTWKVLPQSVRDYWNDRAREEGAVTTSPEYHIRMAERPDVTRIDSSDEKKLV